MPNCFRLSRIHSTIVNSQSTPAILGSVNDYKGKRSMLKMEKRHVKLLFQRQERVNQKSPVPELFGQDLSAEGTDV